ncbi:hypothetical protein EDD17DRAFT_1491945 [Pisolithus thermaeus]|nr:hypothetical protein EDD17DRAFT_1491945 [Pisolithus thermaeus]
MTASSILTTLAHGSAPFLSTFLVIHLSAPIAANIGGSRLASSIMLLGREYYQTTFGERYLLLLPFAIHVTSSIAKRPFTPKSRARFRKLTSLLSISAYAALFLFVPIHVATHRLLPAEADALVWSSSGANLDALGSSELDFEFVKTAIKTWPWRNWILYTGLVGSVLVHAVEGASIIYMRYIRGRVALPSQPSPRGSDRGLTRGNRRTIVIAGVAALLVLTGLWVVSREPTFAPSSVVRRCQVTMMGTWVYRM